MRDYIRLTGVLLIVCVVAAGVLSATNAVTYEKIAEQIIKENDAARRIVLPDATEFVKIDEGDLDGVLDKPNYSIIEEIYSGKSQDKIIGYTVKTVPKGYGGTVEIIIGIDTEGNVKGIKMGENSETPGLGKNAATPKFQEQFKGKNWDNGVSVIKNGTPKEDEVLSITGATVTSNAVTSGVNAALELAKELSNK